MVRSQPRRQRPAAYSDYNYNHANHNTNNTNDNDTYDSDHHANYQCHRADLRGARLAGQPHLLKHMCDMPWP